MKALILAGGLGTRLAEQTRVRPKPMVEIGGHPILWHIMKTYESHDVDEFVVALGYKGDQIKKYFMNYGVKAASLTVDLRSGDVAVHNPPSEEWLVHLLDTGQDTQTGGRVKRAAPLLGDETFMMTYGDGVANVNIGELLTFHRAHGKLATVTAVRPPARFGGLSFAGDMVKEFSEKPQTGEGWINGGFFVLEPKVLEYIEGDDTYFEREPLERLAREGELAAYRHHGYWQCMDTQRDVQLLNSLWDGGSADWKVWSE